MTTTEGSKSTIGRPNVAQTSINYFGMNKSSIQVIEKKRLIQIIDKSTSMKGSYRKEEKITFEEGMEDELEHQGRRGPEKNV